jgi:hypothetical protein
MRRSMRLGLFGTIFPLVLMASVGCGLTPPRLDQPGHIYQQQLRSTFYDPYGAVDLAPEIVGGRPPMFERPRSVPAQSQWQMDAY